MFLLFVFDETLDPNSYVINGNWKDSAGSVLDIYRELIQAGLRIWVFRFVLKFKVLHHEKEAISLCSHIDKKKL